MASEASREDREHGPRVEKQNSRAILVTRHCPSEMRARTSWSVDQFVLAKKLGGGYASTVHLAIDKATGIQVALKIYHRCKLSQLNNYQVQREIRIHGALAHPYILELYAAFQDDVGVYLVTEYASKGDVFGELDRRGGSMTEADAVRQVMLPFLSALEYLHMLHIIHRDIKPENLLFTASGALKVADFGLSIDITQERPVTRVGTLDYMAPEVVVCPDKCHPSDNKELTHLHYTFLVDSWAVGVLAYELTVGRAPFDGGAKQKTIEQILRAQPKYPAWVSEPARHFITWCLTKDATKRPTIQQLAMHPWITSHQQAAKPKLGAARAASFHDLKHFMPTAAGGNPAHPHHTVRFGGMCAPVAEGGGDAGEQQRQKQSSGSAVSDPRSASSNSSCSPRTTPFAAVAAAAVGSPPTTSTALPAWLAGSPCSSVGSASLPPLSPSPPKPGKAHQGGGGFFGLVSPVAAADKLRAFVSRCQSVNNLEGLRAALASMPPEPSNSCFEPGGRFYQGPARPPPPAPQQQQQQQEGERGGSAHSSSAASAASSSPPPPPPAAAAAAAAGAAPEGLHDSSSSWSHHSSASAASAAAPGSPGRGGGADAAPAAAAVAAGVAGRVAKVPGKAMVHCDSCRSLSTLDCIKEHLPLADAAAPAPFEAPLPRLGSGALAVATLRTDEGSPASGPSPAGSPAASVASPGSQLSSAGSSSATFVSASGTGSSAWGDDLKARLAAGGSASSCSSPWGPVLGVPEGIGSIHTAALAAARNSPMAAPQPPSPPSLTSASAGNALAFLQPSACQLSVSRDGAASFHGVGSAAHAMPGKHHLLLAQPPRAALNLLADSSTGGPGAGGFALSSSGGGGAAAAAAAEPSPTYLEDVSGHGGGGVQCFSFLRAGSR